MSMRKVLDIPMCSWTYLVDCYGADLEVLLSDKNCGENGSVTEEQRNRIRRTLNGTLASKIIFKQVLALTALEETGNWR